MAMPDDSDPGRVERDFYRVQTRLPVRLRPVPESGEIELLARAAAEPPIDPKGLPPGLGQWLERLDRKLERLLAVVDPSHDQALSERDVCSITLSGSGLQAPCPGAIEVGERRLVEVLLPGTPSHQLRAIGRVVSNHPQPDGGTRVGLAFETIDERDRDRIIAYVQDLQRVSLRQGGQGEGRA